MLLKYLEKPLLFISIESMKKRKINISKDEALQRLQQESFVRIPLSFYRYVHIENPEQMKEILNELFEHFNCFGRVYIAHEGINAQMSVPEYSFDEFKNTLYALPEFNNVPFKIGIENGHAFTKLHIKIRKQIVADGLTISDYNIEDVGKHLSAKEFNEAMEDPDTLVVDMRNHYESEIGHFEGAITPPADTFREELPMVAKELAPQKEKKILLYCTGGIRCEKASAYLKHKGFKNVHQLHGGIIAYKHEVEKNGLVNKFKGSNYVFDGRGREQIGDEIISHCHQCKALCDRHINCKNFACNLLFLQCHHCEEQTQMTCSKQCQNIVSMSPEKQKIYYQKYGRFHQRKFSKSLKGREKFLKKSPWQKIQSLFVQ